MLHVGFHGPCKVCSWLAAGDLRLVVVQDTPECKVMEMRPLDFTELHGDLTVNCGGVHG